MNDLYWFADNLVLWDRDPAKPEYNLVPYPDGPHRLITDFIMDTEKGFGKNPKTRTLMMMPRGYFKTTLGVLCYVLWLLARNPKEKVLLISAGGDLVHKSMRLIMRHCEKNERLLYYFPRLRPGDPWSVTRASVQGFTSLDAKECSIESKGVGAKATGTHFTRVIFDDVVEEKNTETPEACTKVISYYQLMTPIMEGSGKFAMLRVIGTIWHFADLYNYILAQIAKEVAAGIEPEVAHIKYGVWKEGRDDVPLWPQFHSREDLLAIKKTYASNPQIWANQYLNEVISTDEMLVSPRDLEKVYIDEMPEDWTDWPKFASIDPSMGTCVDQSAIWSWAVSPEGIPFVFDIYSGLVKPPDLIKQIYSLDAIYSYKRIFFEMHLTKQLWIPVLDHALEKFGEISIFGYDRMKNKMSKDARIRALGMFVKAGYLRIWKKAAGVDNMEDQLFSYPRCRTDDILDAGAEMVQRTNPPKHTDKWEDDNPHYSQELLDLWRGGTTSLFMPDWVRN